MKMPIGTCVTTEIKSNLNYTKNCKNPEKLTTELSNWTWCTQPNQKDRNETILENQRAKKCGLY